MGQEAVWAREGTCCSRRVAALHTFFLLSLVIRLPHADTVTLSALRTTSQPCPKYMTSSSMGEVIPSFVSAGGSLELKHCSAIIMCLFLALGLFWNLPWFQTLCA